MYPCMLKHSLTHPEQLSALVGFTQLTFPLYFLRLCTHGLKREMHVHVARLLLSPKTAHIPLSVIPIFFVHLALSGH